MSSICSKSSNSAITARKSREELNENEKMRTKKINFQVLSIRALLEYNNVLSKKDKFSVLYSAYEYIKQLKNELHRMKEYLGIGDTPELYCGPAPSPRLSSSRNTTYGDSIATKKCIPTYESLMLKSMVPMALLSFSGHIVSSNSPFNTLTGFSNLELLSMSIFNLTSAEELPHLFYTIEDIVTKKESHPIQHFWKSFLFHSNSCYCYTSLWVVTDLNYQPAFLQIMMVPFERDHMEYINFNLLSPDSQEEISGCSGNVIPPSNIINGRDASLLPHNTLSTSSTSVSYGTPPTDIMTVTTTTNKSTYHHPSSSSSFPMISHNESILPLPPPIHQEQELLQQQQLQHQQQPQHQQSSSSHINYMNQNYSQLSHNLLPHGANKMAHYANMTVPNSSLMMPTSSSTSSSTSYDYQRRGHMIRNNNSYQLSSNMLMNMNTSSTSSSLPPFDYDHGVPIFHPTQGGNMSYNHNVGRSSNMPFFYHRGGGMPSTTFGNNNHK